MLLIVFRYVLQYTTDTMLLAVNDLLREIVSGGTPDANSLQFTADEISKVTNWIYAGTITVAIITGIVVANITLQPTRKAMQMQKQFIASLAHELRTPLAVMRTNNEVARYDVPEDAPLREVIEENIEQTKQLTNILNNLLVFNRFDQTETIPFEDTDISTIATTVADRLMPLAQKRTVTLTTDIAPGLTVHGNQTAMEQAIFNIVKNAIRYSSESDPWAKLTLKREDGHVAVTVTDNGIGIPKAELSHIFEPFTKSSSDRIRTQSGTGIGLALVYEIMKMHEGSISVHSHEDSGTTVTLRFPIGNKTHRLTPINRTSGHEVKLDFQKNTDV